MATTASKAIIEPLLLSALESAAEARKQSFEILDLLDEYHRSRRHQQQQQQQQPPPPDLQHLSQQQKKLHARLAHLRGLNRRAVLGVRATKLETADARQEIDSLHLQLQNLYYEQRHLLGEIQACRDYRHTYEEIQMLPLEEFVEMHPEYVDASAHDLTQARIADEQEQRLKLEEQRQMLLRRKEALVRETTARKEELARLDAEAEKWMAGAEGVEDILKAHERKVTDEDRVKEEEEE